MRRKDEKLSIFVPIKKVFFIKLEKIVLIIIDLE